MKDIETSCVPPGTITSVRLIEMVFPEQTNHYGTLFGGEALALMDKTAFILGSRYCRRNVVTASSERIDFRYPVQQGQLAEFIGTVIKTGRTSITIQVDMYAENLLSGVRHLCTKGSFVLVALDDDGKPVEIPRLNTLS